MIRLYLFAEGQTEQTFASNLLQPHLARYGVMMHNPVLIAHGRRRGRAHRGGGQNYVSMRNEILRFLKQHGGADVFFTTMIDLYAIHSGFPGLIQAEGLRNNPLERVQFLEKCFKQDIGDSRFIPYIQLHEFEAYLFSDPTLFARIYPNSSRQIAGLQNVAQQFETPELINDGPRTSPSKRILSVFPNYSKVVFGSQLAYAIGLGAIRAKCPHFNSWLTHLEALQPA